MLLLLSHMRATCPPPTSYSSWFGHPNMRRVRKVKTHHVEADRGIFYAYYGNTAVDLDPLPVSRARLTVVEPALFEWDVFEMTPPIQSPTKCEVPSVIRFISAKCEGPAEIHKHMLLLMVTLWIGKMWRSDETSRLGKVRRRWWGARRSHDVLQRAGSRLLWLGDTEAGSKT